MAITEREPTSLSELSRQEPAGDGPSTDELAKPDIIERSASSPVPQPQANRPSLVPLGSNHSSSSTTTTHKKFSAVNIGKKYFEKNAPTTASPTSSNAPAAKTSAAVVRPTVQTPPTHSRLVAAKLTATPFATSPAGWSRPSSVAPTSTPGNNSANSTPPLPSSAATSPAPQNASQQSTFKDSNKPVWGSVKPSVRTDIRQDDFPTAAEVANAKVAAKPKQEDPKARTEAPKSSRIEDADTFRGVHLDPNAHHWDEMPEDDDDFLGGVVEFGDGRQYKVEAVEETGPEPDLVQDRFADDFDRSWPKSQTPPSASRDVSAPIPTRDPSHSPVFSTTTLHSASPRESSRVLFNERSNRLEPYSHNRPPGPLTTGRNEATGQNVRVLHKPPGLDNGPRNRRFSGASAGSSGFPPSPRDGQFGRRDGPPTSPRMFRDPGHAMAPSRSIGGRERDRGSMGPPAVPAHAIKAAQDAGRPLPPHFRDGNPSRPALSAVSPKSPSLPSHSPQSRIAPLSAVSPLTDTTQLPLTGVDVDEVRKELMQTAAARAKQRRQQEEEEREAQKERARRKAQEIEERMNAIEAEKAKQVAEEQKTKEQPTSSDSVDSIIEEAVKSVKIGAPRPDVVEHTSNSAPPTLKSDISPSQEPSSWRAKAAPVPSAPSAPPGTAPQVTRRMSGFVASTTVALDDAVGGVREDLEVVDFADMAKLVDGSRQVQVSPQEEKKPTPNARPSRPVASDFFEDKSEESVWRRGQPKPSGTSTQDDSQPVQARSTSKPLLNPVQTNPPEDHPDQPSLPSPVPPTSTKESLAHPKQANGRLAVNLPSQVAPPRTPRGQTFYKDAGMSSLDDTMSRIKGAIVGMKAHECSKDSSLAPDTSAPGFKPPFKSSMRDRWVPPALRPKNVGFLDEENHEVFSVTVETPPPSPNPSRPTVKLPTVSIRRDPVPKRLLHTFHKPPQPVRLDILSFVPPVEGMKRDLSMNEVLFKKVLFKGRPRIRVLIPRFRGSRLHPSMSAGGPKPVPPGSFGKPTVADGASTWRKPGQQQPSSRIKTDTAMPTGLETMSRSPPPDIPPSETGTPRIPKSTSTTPSPTTPQEEAPAVVLRQRAPKMPAGSAVAFRRDSKIDVVDDNVKTSVNFFVTDELEETAESSKIEESKPPTVQPAAPAPESIKTPLAKPVPQPPQIQSSHSADESRLFAIKSDNNKPTNISRAVSSAQPPPWAAPLPIKESNSRGPDPEHLKALWSQKSDRSELHPVNSLEGIADDLPFTFPDVKSDGVTPPPSVPQPPSRMSLHDVTRAFQQVPQPSVSGSVPPRPAISPPSTNAPVARPTTSNAASTAPANANQNPPSYSYAPMPPNNNMRPSYAPYPSPLMSHSPAPGVLYSPHPHSHPMTASPVPARMGVASHTPLYGQSLWMPIQSPMGQHQNRGVQPSPYPSQLMYGPMHTGGSNLYSPQGGPPPPPGSLQPPLHNMNMQSMSNGAQGNRSRNPGISPIVSHAPPMYQASPLLAHSPMAPGPQNHAYPMPNGRGQPRVDGSNLGNQPPHPTSQQPPHHMYPSHNHQNPPQSFSRTAW
ncbi:hypothetical protein FA15DRAFT_647446 [Coprinopsis marcescibilis]|uniref:Uncharacterized protein n=1 Tax=Coprinopsis marcescibilis TaxID=230819 RepID=A0A5C3KJB7_COPMA|nr:hypothetical protein FA15DRAFT_647446 [Coprinopsis marcescibilis]